MSKTPNFDKKIQVFLDAIKPGQRVCPITKKTWIITQEEIETCKQWKVPPSELHPYFRVKMIGGWGAGVDLWWKPHAYTGKPILCSTHPDSLNPVLPDQEYYEKDHGVEHVIDYDSSRSLFEQQKNLFASCPIPAFHSTCSENCVGGGYNRCVNSFMVFGSFDSKDCWYIFRSRNLENCLDVVFLENSQNSFSCCMSIRLYNCIQVFDSLDCLNSCFLFDCRNCEYCFGAVNKRNRKYLWFNEQLSKEEWENRHKQIDLSSSKIFEDYCKKFRDFVRKEAVWPENINVNIQESQGEYLLDTIRSSGYFMTKATDVKNSWFVSHSQHVKDTVISVDSQDVYSTSVAINSQNIKYCFVTAASFHMEYCSDCRNCEYCFACNGLQRKRFHIFNKPYSEEEYWKRVDELKCAMLDRGEYGKFFPPSFAPWIPQTGFSSVVAPFTQEELEAMDAPLFVSKEQMRYAPYAKDQVLHDVWEVPDSINDIGQEWTGIPFEDKEEGRRFNVNAQELAYRKQKGYPFPRRHYRARFKELIAQVNSPEQEECVCDQCQKQIIINRNPMFPDKKVYCRECYLKYLEQNG